MNAALRPRTLLMGCLFGAAAIFSQTAAENGAALPDIRDAYGVAIADFDGDGLQDIYVVGFRTLNRLLINKGDGTFQDRSIPSGAGGNLMPRGVRNLELGATPVDYDNDGDADLLVAGWGEALELLRNRGDGTFVSVTQEVGLIRDVDANMAVFADLDKDGWLDMLLTNEHGPMRLYRNDHGFRFHPVALEPAGLVGDTGSQTAVFTDLDGDGDLDLAVAGWIHPMRIYEQTHAFRFREVDSLPSLASGSRCNSVVSADIDKDGDFDLLFTRRGYRSVFLLNQSNPPVSVNSPSEWIPVMRFPFFVEAGASWQLPDSVDAYGAVPADFDADGDLDLFLTIRDQASRYYENTGVRFEERLLPHGGIFDTRADYSTATLAADFSSAPGLELFTASRDSACAIQETRLTEKPFLRVIPRGLFSNRNAVGASISLWRLEGETWRLEALREVHSGEGYLSGILGPTLLAFPDSGDVRVRVAFPDGKVAVRRIPATGLNLEIWEGGFFAGAWTRFRRDTHLFLHDPARIKFLLAIILFAAAGIFGLRWILRRMAQTIARRKYLREVEDKNRELERLIAEVKRAQQQMIQSEKLAALGQLVAGIAHELNNPIGFIYANLHQMQGYLDEIPGADPERRDALLRKSKSALEESRDGAKRVRDIVQNLRGISRAGMSAPAGVLEKKPNDLNQLLDKTLVLAQTGYSKSVVVEKNFGELPPVPCDATQIQQVFLNVLVNAGQAMGDAGTVRLRTWKEGDFVFASVADSGSGISPENLKRLFEPFFTTKPIGQGLGLGLHISYDIARAHGGTLEAKSEPGRGAEFVLKLPVLA